jgi:DNA (cytosine-5)-methyltransferase 1
MPFDSSNQTLQCVDCFAGAGGASEAFNDAFGFSPHVAINHSPVAIAIHAANHPGALHLIEDIFAVDVHEIRRRGPIGHVQGSPTCTHFSRASGAALKDAKLRCQAWVLLKWAVYGAPMTMSLENVSEFVTWGPLDQDGRVIQSERGRTFAAFVACLTTGIAPNHPDIPEIVFALGQEFPIAELIKGLGFVVEWRNLVASDYGAATIRTRLYMIMRRDGRPIVWPTPTHGNPKARGFADSGRLPWCAVSDCVDWTVPMQSIFTRPKPLADSTLDRIASGLDKFVINCPDPFLIDAAAVAGIAGASVDHSDMVAAFVVKMRGNNTGSPLTEPLHTISAQGQHHALCAAFLIKYYGNEDGGHSLTGPLGTITTRDRFGLVVVSIDGVRFTFGDIYMRMFTPRELARAQGFPDTYKLDPDYNGRPVSKRAQVMGIGNSVARHPMAAIFRANLGDYYLVRGVAA